MNARILRLAAASGCLLANAAMAAQGGGGSESKDRQASTETRDGAPTVVLVPLTLAIDRTFANGCWARLYDGRDFRGDRLALVGPADMPDMRTGFGKDWGGEFDSVEVGPKATLTVYDGENYSDRAASFKPGERITDMGERMGLFEDVRSLKLACAGGATAQGSGASRDDASTGASSSEKRPGGGKAN